MTMKNTITLTDRELAVTIAALRYWQRARAEADKYEHDIATDGGRFAVMCGQEIDELCFKINTGARHS